MSKPHIVTMFINHEGIGRVTLDGVELNTTHVQVDSHAQRPPKVTLTVYADVQVALETDSVTTEEVVRSTWGQS